MSIIPTKYISEQINALGRRFKGKPMNGWLAISPLIVFLAVFLVSSVIANDFYAVPVSAAFIIASVYAIAISKGRSLEDRLAVFSKGA